MTIPTKRLDGLDPTTNPQRDHEVAAMRDGISNKLRIEQILALLQSSDIPNGAVTLAKLAADARAASGHTFDDTIAQLGLDPADRNVQKAIEATLERLSGFARFLGGQSRLILDGANLRLSRFGGQFITIDSVAQEIPSGGVALAPTGLTPATLYYIYAFMSSGTMTLEASITAPATDATNGMRIKAGDSSRTLVGMARPVTGPAWVDSAAQRFVRSWFNRKPVNCLGAGLAGTRTTTSTSLVEINSEARFEFLIWPDETIALFSTGHAFSSSASGYVRTAVGIDGTSIRTRTSEVRSADGGPSVAVGAISELSEGYHDGRLLGAVDVGTGSWAAASGSRDAVNIGGTIYAA